MVGNGTKVLKLIGQDSEIGFIIAGFRKAIGVLVLQTSEVDDLEEIHFVDRNARRLGLFLKKTGDWGEVAMTFDQADQNPIWRLLIASENVPLARGGGPSGTVNMIGGITTDRDFKWGEEPDKVLYIRRETSPKFLERLAPRTAWIESYSD